MNKQRKPLTISIRQHHALFAEFKLFKSIALTQILLWMINFGGIEWHIWKLILRSSYIYEDKFPDFFRMGTFIDSTHMKL